METPKIDVITDVEGCVYKLLWGEAYIIIKAKTFLRSKMIVEDSLGRFLRYGKVDLMYNKFFFYIKTHPFYSFRTELLYKSDNPYRLLIKEQLELNTARKDTNCFNNSFDAYVPKGIQGNRKAWINRGHYLNFMIWKKKYEAKTAS